MKSNTYKVTRTFHPIGQGGFYTEYHHNDNLNIVYDCGEWKRSKLAKSVINSVFSKDDLIDVLFISHLDYDHISLIPTLKNAVKDIRAVVMPLLDKEEKNLLINLNRALSKSILRLIRNPNAFFGPNTKIIYISSDPDNIDGITDNVEYLEQPLSEIINSTSNNSQNIVLRNNNPLRYHSSSKWIFLPHNINYQNRNADLINKLNLNGFDINKLKTDPNYTATILGITKEKNKLKKIYEALEGDINENSMLLYSGPSHLTEKSNCKCVFKGDGFNLSDSSPKSSGCIYTGDTDLNKVFKEREAFLAYKDYVGVVQIPHHGSNRNFCLSFFKHFNPIICPVSFGTKNTYHHPDAGIINTLSIKGFKPIHINENSQSKLIQEIEVSF